MNKWLQALSTVIDLQFHLLFILTPLIFTPFTSELFEFNKMIVVYILTITILTSTLIRMSILGKLSIPKTPFDIPLLAILISRILATVFSIDPHTSLWGYYSRFNEGLFSTFAYIILFYCFVLHFRTNSRLKNILFTLYTSGILVALWGIPGYFGYDISCLFINHKLSVTCWQLDSRPTERLYSTMGQANWLAALMSMTIPLGLGYILLETARWKKFLHLGLITAMYFALTVTFSRGGTLGFLAGIGVFGLITVGLWRFRSIKDLAPKMSYFVRFVPFIVIAFVMINLLFGTAFTRRPVNVTKISGTALERDSSESGQIRLIVWRAAIDIFQRYPLFGSGLETFAYSYNMFKPLEHNQTVEWEYIYNKAHNEYLNSLATTGILGFGSLLAFITVFFWQSYQVIRKSRSLETTLFVVSLVSAYAAYLTQNTVGFSVVVLSLLSFLIPALITSFRRGDENDHPVRELGISPSLTPLLGITSIIAGTLLMQLPVRIWVADYHYSNAGSYLSGETIEKGIEEYKTALSFKEDPTYHSALATAYTIQATRSDTLDSAAAKNAIDEAYRALRTSPFNLSYYKDLYWVYSELGAYKSDFFEEAYKIMKESEKIAPHDPRIVYNQAEALSKYHFATSADQEEIINIYKKAISLKPNWIEPYVSLGEFYIMINQPDNALRLYQEALSIDPTNAEIQKAIEKLPKQPVS